LGIYPPCSFLLSIFWIASPTARNDVRGKERNDGELGAMRKRKTLRKKNPEWAKRGNESPRYDV